MKYKNLHIIVGALLFATTVFYTRVQAEEFTPIAKLAQDYIQRLNEDLKEAREAVPTRISDAVVVNPEAVVVDAVTESIDTISKTVREVKIQKEQVVNTIKENVKQDIDESIINIRKQNIDTPAFELQRAIDTEREVLFDAVSRQIDQIKPVQNSGQIETLQSEIDDSIIKIEQKLEEESGLPVTFERSKRDIRETLLKFQEVLVEKQKIIESRQGELVFLDSDSDGISDYDEIYLYKTDPNNARTVDGEKTDGEKIREGINPLSIDGARINFQDPREDRESFVSDAYRLEKVELIKEEKKLVFEGYALPNTYITLFIFSTPIIVTVRTDESGKWSYQLEKELEDGEHQVYVASTDTSGKIIARSNPILFTKSAEAATIGIAGSIDTSVTAQSFLKDNFILIALAILIAVVVLTMMFAGNHKTIGSAVSDLKNQLNSK